MLTDGLYQAVISIVINIELFYLNIYNKMIRMSADKGRIIRNESKILAINLLSIQPPHIVY